MHTFPSHYRYGCLPWVLLSCQYHGYIWHGMQGLLCLPPEASVGHIIGRMSPETLLRKGKQALSLLRRYANWKEMWILGPTFENRGWVEITPSVDSVAVIQMPEWKLLPLSHSMTSASIASCTGMLFKEYLFCWPNWPA